MLGVAARIYLSPHGLDLEGIAALDVVFGYVFYESGYAVRAERDAIDFTESLYAVVGSELQEDPVGASVGWGRVFYDVGFEVGDFHVDILSDDRDFNAEAQIAQRRRGGFRQPTSSL